MASQRVKSALIAAAIFAALASPQAYAFTNSLGLVQTADASGAPTQAGLILHAAIYFIIVYYMNKAQ